MNSLKKPGVAEHKKRAEEEDTEEKTDSAEGELESQTEAATKIQASYRGYSTRKRLKKMPAKSSSDESDKNAKERDDPTSDQNQGETTEEKSIDDVSNEQQDAAAVRIQASFRGYKTRKNLKTISDQKESVTQDVAEASEPTNIVNDENISEEALNEAATKIQASARGYIERKKIARSHQAATKIQANYRGFKTRKSLKTSNTTENNNQ